MIIQTFSVEGMSCASCASSVESLLGASEGIKSAEVNLASNSVLVSYDEKLTDFDRFSKILEPAGYKLLKDISASLEEEEKKHAQHLSLLLGKLIGAAIFSIPVFILSMFFHLNHNLYYVQFALTIPLLWFGRQFYIIGFKRLFFGKASMDTLIALGTSSAFLFSTLNTFFPQLTTLNGQHPQVYFESAGIIITFILLGRYLEERAKFSTTASIRKLLALQVKTAFLVTESGEKEVTIESILPGNKIIIKPGAKIPVDGSIESGSSFIDESMMSGESKPVEKTFGELVIGGTINTSGSFIMKATRVGSDTVLAHIIRQVKEAQGSKAPIQAYADKIAAVFVPAVLAIAAATFIMWYWLAADNHLAMAFNALFTVLVIACPCALGLATPTAIIAGIGRAAEFGILIKDAAALENTCKIDALAIDKTGTITSGIQSVSFAYPAIETINDSIKNAIFSIESRSEHPVAQAVKKTLLSQKIEEIYQFENHSGMGVSAFVGKHKYYIGNELLLKNHFISLNADFIKQLEMLKQQKQSIVLVCEDNNVVLLLGISDTVKPGAAEAIHKLQKNNIDVHLLSGDNENIVAYVAKENGIAHYKASMLPSDKADYIKALQAKGLKIGMAGDGINDAPALAIADVGFAMENGAEVAVHTAQIILLRGDINKIERSIDFSKKTSKVIRQNLFWAFIYNIIAIPVAAGVFYPIWGLQLSPMIAGAAMAFSSVSVITNSLRLRYLLK